MSDQMDDRDMTDDGEAGSYGSDPAATAGAGTSEEGVIVGGGTSIWDNGTTHNGAPGTNAGNDNNTPEKEMPRSSGSGGSSGGVVETGQEHTGRWTRTEHEAFLKGLQMYGKEWKKVAAGVKTRTVVQTRTHAQKYFQKLQKTLSESSSKGGAAAAAVLGTTDGMTKVEMGVALAATAKKGGSPAAAALQMASASATKRRRSSKKKNAAAAAAAAAATSNAAASAATHAAAHLMAQLSNVPSTSPSTVAAVAAAAAAAGAAGAVPTTAAPVGLEVLNPPTLLHHEPTRPSTNSPAHNFVPMSEQIYSSSTTTATAPPSSTTSFPATGGGGFVPSLRITAPDPETSMKRGYFPEPSPAACGKRKLAEIAAAQMLAGVAAGSNQPSSSSTGTATVSATTTTTTTVAGPVGGGGAAAVSSPPLLPLSSGVDGDVTPPPRDQELVTSGGFAILSQQQQQEQQQRTPLQIVNPETLGVDYSQGTKKRSHGQESPTTPWDGQLEELKSKVIKGKDVVEEMKSRGLDLPVVEDDYLMADSSSGVADDSSSLSVCRKGFCFGRSPLHRAICECAVDEVKNILLAETELRKFAMTQQAAAFPNQQQQGASGGGGSSSSSSSAALSQRDEVGFFPLHSAAAVDSPEASQEMAHLLLSNGNAAADSACIDADGNTPLHWAARCGNDEVAQMLLLKNCNPDIQNKSGETALHWAMRAGKKGARSVRILIEAGARPFVFCNSFKRPLDVAAEGFDSITSEVAEKQQQQPSSSDKKRKNGKENAAKRAAIVETRANLLVNSQQSRTLVLHHKECLEHLPKSNRDWEVPDRVNTIMDRIKTLVFEGGVQDKPSLRNYELTISTEFDRAKIELLSRVHSAEYLSFVNDLSKELEQRKKSAELEGGSEKDEGGERSDPSVVPFTPQVQRKILLQASAIKREQHSDTSFSAGSLRAARRAAGAVQHAVDCVLVGRNRNAFCVVRPPGHHAGIKGLLAGGDSCGFCIFNNVAAGALHAISNEQHRPLCERCAIVDIDVHHGNGTEEIIRNCHDPARLLFFSIHLFDHEKRKKGGSSSQSYRFYPGTGDEDDVAHNIINVPIAPLWKEKEVMQGTNGSAASPPKTRHYTRQRSKKEADQQQQQQQSENPSASDTDASETSRSSYRPGQKTPTPSPRPTQPTHFQNGTGRQAYRNAIRNRLLPALRAFNPDLVLISAGFDAAKGDVGNSKHFADGKSSMGLDLEPEDYAWTTSKIMEVADICCQGRVVSVLEGGYGKPGESSSKNEEEVPLLDKSGFAACAVRHLQALVDPYNVEMRY